MAEEADDHDPIGSILIQVHEDLHQLKEKLTKFQCGENGKTLDIQNLETAIHRTEMGLKIHVEKYLHVMNHQVLLNPVDESSHSPMASKWLYDNTAAGDPGNESMPCGGRSPTSKRLFVNSILLVRSEPKMMGLNVKVMQDPEHIHHRAAVNASYGISLPHVTQRKAHVTAQKLIKGSTISNLTLLPSSQRVDSHFVPKPALQKDTSKG
ncbi:IQ domain-containing protein H-like [Ctenodactylus gundi]